MPYFESYTEVQVDVEEFLDACSQREKEQLAKLLFEEGLMNPEDHLGNALDQEWSGVIAKISGMGRLSLSNEEEEVIHKIANRL